MLSAEHGTESDLRAILAAIRQDAENTRATLTEMADELTRGARPFPFPQRARINFLVLALHMEQFTAVMR